jgi:hypothetical protein
MLYRRPNIFFSITSPLPGTFIIAMHFKGRDKPILEMDLKLDDLLEKVHMNDGKEKLFLIPFFFSNKIMWNYWILNMFV